MNNLTASDARKAAGILRQVSEQCGNTANFLEHIANAEEQKHAEAAEAQRAGSKSAYKFRDKDRELTKPASHWPMYEAKVKRRRSI